MEERILKTFEKSGFRFYNEKTKSFIIEKTLVFLEELDKWNPKIGLISKGDQDRILERHFTESLHYLKGLKGTNRLVDIGSGAGFPGIPLKICFPELDIVLVESQRKRVGFLGSALRKMNLKSYEVAFGRAEEIGLIKKYKQSFDTATFRSVASFDQCLELGSQFLKWDGKILLKKESDFESHGNGVMTFSKEIFFDTSKNKKSKLMIFKKKST